MDVSAHWLRASIVLPAGAAKLFVQLRGMYCSADLTVTDHLLLAAAVGG